LGIGQVFAGQAAASRIKEASTARPSEYAELLKQARNADLEQRRLEELNRSIATGIAAAQGLVVVLLSERCHKWFVLEMLVP
jgi:hypothetical protein